MRTALETLIENPFFVSGYIAPDHCSGVLREAYTIQTLLGCESSLEPPQLLP